MERSISVEEKIRRAEEIYAKRHEHRSTNLATVNINDKKDIKLLKKTIIQIIISLCIYLILQAIQMGNYVFSNDCMNKVKEVLSYDINFGEIFNSANLWLKQVKMQNNEEEKNTNSEEEKNITQDEEITSKEDAIGGAEEVKELTQEEQDIENIKNTCTFIKPVEGEISSKYGLRNPTTASVPKNHTGTDISANLGTKIKSATDGEVLLVSEKGDYGKHVKIRIGEVTIIYAHCNIIYVKEGDKIVQGQEIAEVGSTGNSTGPHLHFEIRIFERTVDPEKILEL
ncbi:MAG: M23 family metallopeptidase [Clostridia bacterium]|nr:M23 family metallopeptidase [Clostridia bacterium]